MEDEDRPLFRRQSPEPAVELVVIVDGQVPIAGSRFVRLEQDDVRREAPATSGLGVAGVDEDPMEPRLEPIGVAQGRELPPHLDEGHLDRVFGEVDVAQDPVRDEDAAVADRTNQGAEGLLVALLRSIHEGPKHPLPPCSWRRSGAINEHESGRCVNRSNLTGEAPVSAYETPEAGAGPSRRGRSDPDSPDLPPGRAMGAPRSRPRWR